MSTVSTPSLLDDIRQRLLRNAQHAGATAGPALASRLGNIAYCVTDSRGNFTDVSPGYARLLGYHPEDLVGRHFTVVVPPNYKELAAAQQQAFVGNGTRDDLYFNTFTIQGKDGGLISIRVDAVLVNTSEGTASKITIVTPAK